MSSVAIVIGLDTQSSSVESITIKDTNQITLQIETGSTAISVVLNLTIRISSR